MGFLYKTKANVGDACNPYYFGNGCFNFPGLHENFSLRIIDEFKLKDYSNLYECNLCYNYDDSDCQNLFYRLVVGFDSYKMIHDSKYTRFVFDRVINRKNLMEINDFNYDFIDGSRNINYIGSVIEINGNLVFYDDDNIRNVVNVCFQTKGISDDKRRRALMSSINRQAKIESLKQEREKLISQEKIYKSSKNK